MDQRRDSTAHGQARSEIDPAKLRRLFMISLLPFLGVMLFAAAGALGLRAFAHNNSLECGGGFASAAGETCVQYSYAIPTALGLAALLLVMGGGLFASYYAARNVGLPLLGALQYRRRTVS
ncbi:MAG: hypothetical protein LC789_08120 [Actinobacteria bacterium]|nr:hypothetical protein [Actinomycetota bacterium]MCA1720066.1 hypothetical protein [Actinomycetota bacterium]